MTSVGMATLKCTSGYCPGRHCATGPWSGGKSRDARIFDNLLDL